MTMTSNVIDFPAEERGASAMPRRQASEAPAAPCVSLDEHRAARAPRELSLSEVWQAIADDRLEMHYQPQYDLATGEAVGTEALLRLLDRDGGIVSPDRFIGAAEHSDLIVPLGRAVIERVCEDLQTLRTDGVSLQRVAVNVSAHQLHCDTGLVAFLDETLAATGLDYTDLEFELTERQRLDADGDGGRTLEILAARGARITIDDFGIGYSSVVCLTDLPVQAFKLDRSLVNRLPDDQAMRSVIETLLKLGRKLGLDVVAEGVETVTQHEWLVEAGCPSGQGFGYAEPMPTDALLELLGPAPRATATQPGDLS